MNKFRQLVSALLLGSLAVAVNAMPIDVNSAANTLSSSPTAVNSSYLKMGGSNTQIFNNATATAFDLSSLVLRARPTIVTQAMTMPAVQTSGMATTGAQTMVTAAAQSAPGAASGNNVLVVSEPPLLLLLAMGLLLAGIRRKA